MSGESIAQRYARAIFELGVESSNLERLSQDIRKLADTFEESPEMQKIMGNPLIPEQDRQAAIRDIAETLGLSPLGINTAGLLTRRKRMSALPTIAAELDMLADEQAGIVRATVTSAEPLSEEYEQKLTEELSAKVGKKIVIERKQDPDLLAGLVVRIGDQVIDGSARARLSELLLQLLSA